ncbi:MAG: hypothetical protein M1829_004081 [Trizodia sp. TS-e1964]|nr:MAG: hypothetical protein M1829_004081 [Trizodia sp. TS-e1964]
MLHATSPMEIAQKITRPAVQTHQTQECVRVAARMSYVSPMASALVQRLAAIFLNAHPSGWANLINCPQTPQWQVDSGSCNDKDVYTWKAAEFLGISFTTHLPTSTAASSTVTVTVTSAGNPAVMAAAETAPVCADNKSDTSSHMKVGLAVGLGLGIPLLGLAAAFAALWLREVRKNRATSYSEMAVHKPIEGQPRDLYEADTRNAETQELDAGQGGAGVSYR